jgi:hypothetical protein
VRRILRVGFLVYVVVLAVGVFGPVPSEPVRHAAGALRSVEDRVVGSPSSTTAGEPAREPARSRADEAWYEDWSAEEVLNVLLFVPFGVLVPLLWPRLRWWTVPLGVAASCGIELVQGAFLSWRSQRLVDVETNSLGVVAGFAAYLALVLAVAVSRRRRGG